MATQDQIDMENTKAILENTKAIETLTKYFLEGGILKFPQIITNSENKRFSVDIYSDETGTGFDITPTGDQS